MSLLKQQIEAWGGRTDRSGIVYAASGYAHFLAYWVDDDGRVSGIGMRASEKTALELVDIAVL